MCFSDIFVVYGDEAVEFIKLYDNVATEALIKYGDEALEVLTDYGDEAAEGFKNGKTLDEIRADIESGSSTTVKPSNPYDADAKPRGTATKITDNMDDATKRSLKRENEAAVTLAKNGYDIEQNPTIEGTTRKPDYLIEGEVFDCYSPAENTSARNIGSTIEEKVIKKGQANNVVLNLDDWKGNIEDIIK